MDKERSGQVPGSVSGISGTRCPQGSSIRQSVPRRDPESNVKMLSCLC